MKPLRGIPVRHAAAAGCERAAGAGRTAAEHGRSELPAAVHLVTASVQSRLLRRNVDRRLGCAATACSVKAARSPARKPTSVSEQAPLRARAAVKEETPGGPVTQQVRMRYDAATPDDHARREGFARLQRPLRRPRFERSGLVSDLPGPAIHSATKARKIGVQIGGVAQRAERRFACACRSRWTTSRRRTSEAHGGDFVRLRRRAPGRAGD